MTTLAKRLLSLLLLAGLGTVVAGAAESPAPRDLIIVLDNSGSMRKADPERRVRGAVLDFATRIGARDRLSLLLFDHRVRVLQTFGSTGAAAAEALRGPIERLDYRGRFTDIAGAIDGALQEFEANARPDAERVIIFLTDGIIDTGDAARDAERGRWLREELTADAVRAGVRIHSIAFTPQADAGLVQFLAETTGATFVRAKTVADLGPAFAALTARLAPSPAVTTDEAVVAGGQAGPDAEAEASSAPALATPPAAAQPPPAVDLAAPDARSTEAMPAVVPEAEGSSPADDPARAQLTERLGVAPGELESLLTATQLAPADLLALVDDAGLTLEQLRGMAVGQTVVSRPGEAPLTMDTSETPNAAVGADTALERLGTRIGGAPEEAQRLVDSTRLPAEDLLSLLDEAGLTIEELQGLAVGDAVVTRPGQGATAIVAPAADTAPEAGESGVGSTATSAGDPALDAASAADPQVQMATPGAAPPQAADQPLTGPPGAPMWVMLTALGGIVLIAVGSLLALRPRGGRSPLESAAPRSASPDAVMAVADIATSTRQGASAPPEAWLSDPQRHSGKERIQLGGKALVIGRVAGTEPERLDYLVLNQPTIGRRHALIEFRDLAWFVCDLGSVNGTFVNGQRLGGQAQRLRGGDRIRFHRYEFGFVQPLDVVDADATVIAQLPGEATLIADRTVTAATGAGLATGLGVAAGLEGAAAVPGSAPATPPLSASPAGASANAEPLPDSLDTDGSLSATSDLTEPSFNPAAQHFEDEAGLDLFMASQMFAATNRPAEDLLGSEAARASRDGSTVILPGPLVAVDLPLDADADAEGVEAGERRAATWPRDEESGTPSLDAAPSSPRPEVSPETDGASRLVSSGIFDEDFFGTQGLPPTPAAPARSEAVAGERGPADVFFPSTSAPVTPGKDSPASRVSAPDHPPLLPEDDLFTEYPAGLEPAHGTGVVPDGLDDTDAFFATLIQPAAAVRAAVPGTETSEARGESPSAMTTDEAEDLFATVFHGQVSGVSVTAHPPAPGTETGPALSPPAGDTLRVRADRTVLLGESKIEAAASPFDAPTPAAEPPQGGSAPGTAGPGNVPPIPRGSGDSDVKPAADDIDPFFGDDDRT